MSALSESEKELFELLKEDELSLFESYTDAWSYVNSETNRDSFRNGFKNGAKFIIDVFRWGIIMCILLLNYYIVLIS